MIDRTEAIIGTHIRIAVNSISPLAASAVEAAFADVRRIERLYSRFIDDNELSRLNARQGEWVAIPDELYGLLEYGLKLEAETAWAFSLWVKGVLESWGYDAGYNLGQETETPAVGTYELDGAGHARLSGEIEIGGLGKWYALDRMTAILADYADVFINAGGDVYGRGYDADGPWVCYLEHPKNPDQAIGEIVLDKKYFASSSPLRRRWRNRHHLVDARAREPASLMTAVYVEGATGLAADGYSTALFVSGYDRAKLLAEERGLAAVLVSPEGDIYRSSGFSGRLYGLD